MASRKLAFLGYPEYEDFDLYSEIQTHKLIIWLEERVFKVLDDKERLELEASDDSWKDAFIKFLGAISCKRNYSKTMSEEDQAKIIDWIICEAISIKYGENEDLYNTEAEDILRRKEIETKLKLSDSINEKEFADAINKICKTLGLPLNEDPNEALKVLCLIAEGELGEKMQEAKESKAGASDFKSTIENYPLGFQSKDPQVDAISCVLRMLYVRDLRDLQSAINNLIVSAQELTADPKADASLGKVGK